MSFLAGSLIFSGLWGAVRLVAERIEPLRDPVPPIQIDGDGQIRRLLGRIQHLISAFVGLVQNSIGEHQRFRADQCAVVTDLGESQSLESRPVEEAHRLADDCTRNSMAGDEGPNPRSAYLRSTDPGFRASLEDPRESQERLLKLTPALYTANAQAMAEDI